MRRFMRLFHNEWTKLFARPLIYIMFAIILLITFFFGLIMREGSSYSYEKTYEEYKKDWQPYMRSYIAMLESQKQEAVKQQENPGDEPGKDSGAKGEIIYEESGRTVYRPDMDVAESPAYYDAMIEYARLCLEKGIDGGSWKLFAMEEMARQKAVLADAGAGEEQKAGATALIQKLQGFVDKNDWRGYLSDSQQRKEYAGDADKKQDKEILRLRLAYDIEPFHYPHSDYSIVEPWQDRAVQNYGATVYQLEMGIGSNGPMTAEEKQRLKDDLAKLEYRLKHDIAPVRGVTFGSFVGQGNSLIMVVSLCVIILAATQVASEYTSGTVKLLLIAPYRRWKILLSKIVLMIVVSIIMYGVLMLSSVIVGLIFFGTGGVQPHVTVLGGKAVGLPFPLFVVLKYLLAYPELLVFTSLAVMLAVVMRHSAVAIGTGVALMFGGSFINLLLPMIRRDFTRFFLHPNLNLGQYFTGFYEGDIVGSLAKPLHSDMTVWFSLAVLAVYLICINAIAFDSFSRRDIK